VLVESRARTLPVIEHRVAGPAVAIADDVALAVFPAAGSLLLLGLNDSGTLLVALASRKLHAVLVDGRGVAERDVVGVQHVFDLELPVAVIDVAMHADVKR